MIPTTLNINTQIYAVHKAYAHTKLKNGRVLVGKVKSYQNVNGVIYPIIKEVGSPVIIDVRMHEFYLSLVEAVDAITTEEKVIITKKKTKQSKSVLLQPEHR